MPAGPGWPRLSYHATETPHRYEVRVQQRPRAACKPIGWVQRFGSLPSMRHWQGLGAWSASCGWTRSRDTREHAGHDVLDAWQQRLPAR
jgi:hypothetical protein